MTPERLDQIRELFLAALADPGVLDNVDPELRTEVQSLLAHDQAPLPSLSPAVVLGLESADLMLRAGTQIGSYIIQERVGEGGMGVVYRALDSKLNRPVAVKFLSADTGDPAARQRFQREAQMASSLNHPHILTVHDVGEFEGREYLVTEFVEGGTLREWARSQKRTWREIVELLAGVADGLAAAHEAGILHRDIKPENILIAKDRYAKLADFGLAKLAKPAVPDISRRSNADDSRPGMIFGTIAYLSPEQAAGRSADARSDIFSFGVVLYELLASFKPFAGATVPELLFNIAHHAPEAMSIDVPDGLRATVEKTLEKDPADRYQTARDLLVDLRHALRQKPQAPYARGPMLPFGKWITAAALVALFVGLILWNITSGASGSENPLANATFTRLTGYEGTEVDAAISPDGKFVAFLSNRTGPFHAWVSQIGSGTSIDVTPGAEDVRGPLRSVGFSGDGAHVWIEGTEKRRVRLLPLMGGEARTFLASKAVSPSWSSDGSSLVYNTSDPGDPIFIADRDGANSHQIFRDSPDKHNHFPSWGADGEWIYFAHGTPASGEMELWRIRARGGQPERLATNNMDVRDPVAWGSKTILYIARNKDGLGPWIWAYDLRRKTGRRITLGLEQYTSLAASSNGHRLAATVSDSKAGLWSVPILDTVAEEDKVEAFSVTSAGALAPRFRGDALYYLASQGSSEGLWRFQAHRANEVWGAAPGSLPAPPAISADGSHIAMVVRQGGKRTLRVMTADGAEARAAAPGLEVDGAADWSPDGAWIVVGGNDGKGEGLFKIPAAGGDPVRITNEVGRNPVWSPDGAMIAYSGANVFTLTPLRIIRPDGTPVRAPDVRIQRGGERLRFLPDSSGLVYMKAEEATPWQDFWLLDLHSMTSRRLTRLTDRALMRTFDVSPDGRRIVFDRQHENSAVVLIDINAKP